MELDTVCRARVDTVYITSQESSFPGLVYRVHIVGRSMHWIKFPLIMCTNLTIRQDGLRANGAPHLPVCPK